MEEFKIKIEETIKLKHDIIVEAENEDDILNLLIKAGENGKANNIDECADYLECNGIEIVYILEDKQGESILDCDGIERVI